MLSACPPMPLSLVSPLTLLLRARESATVEICTSSCFVLSTCGNSSLTLPVAYWCTNKCDSKVKTWRKKQTRTMQRKFCKEDPPVSFRCAFRWMRWMGEDRSARVCSFFFSFCHTLLCNRQVESEEETRKRDTTKKVYNAKGQVNKKMKHENPEKRRHEKPPEEVLTSLRERERERAGLMI
mmetsp:Transcript_25291/g.49430  ORF Transcript_25291/g.49430 Transcript_25291/m.49430 type:complete len:181 (+) Transcript_25291:1589-2131(+)